MIELAVIKSGRVKGACFTLRTARIHPPLILVTEADITSGLGAQKSNTTNKSRRHVHGRDPSLSMTFALRISEGCFRHQRQWIFIRVNELTMIRFWQIFSTLQFIDERFVQYFHPTWTSSGPLISIPEYDELLCAMKYTHKPRHCESSSLEYSPHKEERKLVLRNTQQECHFRMMPLISSSLSFLPAFKFREYFSHILFP